MRLTNKYNLPPPILEALRKDPYSKGDAHFSVTELIESPRIHALRRKHFDEIERDASDMVWSLLGRAVHDLLERHGRRAGLHDYVEERLFLDIEGWRISGGMDLWIEDDGKRVITDYKFTTAKASFGKVEWERQLNIYAYLFWANKGVMPDGLQVCAIIRDWKKEAAIQPDYPKAPIWRVPVSLWTREEQEGYLRQRIAAHASVRSMEAFGEPPPPCTDEERWKRGGTWALLKVGNKRATAVFETEDEARRALDETAAIAKKGVEYTLDFRPALPHRCMHYCDVAPFCSQWQAEQAVMGANDERVSVGGED